MKRKPNDLSYKSHPLYLPSEMYLGSKSLAPKTLHGYRNTYKQFMRYLMEVNVLYATTRDVINYKEMKETTFCSDSYMYIQISALKGLYLYLSQHQKRLNLPLAYAHNIMIPIRNHAVKPRVSKKVLSKKQAKHLLTCTKVNRHYIWDYRDHAIVSLMLTSGLSMYDICHIKKEDFNIQNGKGMLKITHIRSKKGDTKIVTSDGSRDALEAYLCKRKDDNPYLFISHKKVSPDLHLSHTFFIHMFNRILTMCDLDHLGFTPHSLRHTAGVMNLKRGGTLFDTKALMRHVSLQSTQIYQEYLERLEDDTECQIDLFIMKHEDD